MIAGVIGLTAIAAVLSVYIATVRHANDQLGSAHLQHQLDSLLYLMTTDIRRAGFWQFDPAVDAVTANPFTTVENRIRIGSPDDTSTGPCLLFSYDLDKDGRLGIGNCQRPDCADTPDTDTDNVEQFGFRLREGRVQSRYGGRVFSCDTGYWQTLNATDIEITELTFSLLNRCINLDQTREPCDGSGPELLRQATSIKLSGQRADQPETGTVRERWIQIRNDIMEDRR